MILTSTMRYRCTPQFICSAVDYTRPFQSVALVTFKFHRSTILETFVYNLFSVRGCPRISTLNNCNNKSIKLSISLLVDHSIHTYIHTNFIGTPFKRAFQSQSVDPPGRLSVNQFVSPSVRSESLSQSINLSVKLVTLQFYSKANTFIKTFNVIYL